MGDEGEPVAHLLPEQLSLPALRDAAAGCKACDLHQLGTQTVFGEGPARARIAMVGEQPGDQEDRTGHPFVGPAGAVLDRALEDAAIDRSLVYMTNAVKHFKWTARGKRRIHEKPNRVEVAACLPWLEVEIATVRPEVIVALGATAAQALLGPGFRVSKQRGQLIASTLGPPIVATVHPSAVLRAPDDQARQLAYEDLVRDLKQLQPFTG